MLKSETVSFRAKEIRAEDLSAAIAALRRGDVIAFPTETLYGLGADALDDTAVEKVFQLKGRDPKSPIPVLVADRDMLLTLVVEVPLLAEPLIARFWPGPLTIVLPARQDIPRPLVSSTGGVGVRISSQPIANELVNGLGRPLTATSANPSGMAPARTVVEARKYFTGQIEVCIDGGQLTSITGSTVVEIIGETLRIIRAGDISRAQLETALGAGRIVP
ncbi:MAG TPA: L-threonylcarbamoyladenylate synthase [Candidatus Limnocylindria bacterium]|nr:L-threonylcarbamoyladenylate synthase [Candidatus Limnocylindria bacterium]